MELCLTVESRTEELGRKRTVGSRRFPWWCAQERETESGGRGREWQRRQGRGVARVGLHGLK
jgi:hypothetical protein